MGGFRIDREANLDESGCSDVELCLVLLKMIFFILGLTKVPFVFFF